MTATHSLCGLSLSYMVFFLPMFVESLHSLNLKIQGKQIMAELLFSAKASSKHSASSECWSFLILLVVFILLLNCTLGFGGRAVI